MKRVNVMAMLVALLLGLCVSHAAFAAKGPPDGQRGNSNVVQLGLESVGAPLHEESWGQVTVKVFRDEAGEITSIDFVLVAKDLLPGEEYEVKSTGVSGGTAVANGGGNLQISGTIVPTHAAGKINLRLMGELVLTSATYDIQ